MGVCLKVIQPSSFFYSIKLWILSLDFLHLVSPLFLCEYPLLPHFFLIAFLAAAINTFNRCLSFIDIYHLYQVTHIHVYYFHDAGISNPSSFNNAS